MLKTSNADWLELLRLLPFGILVTIVYLVAVGILYLGGASDPWWLAAPVTLTLFILGD